MTRPFYFGSDFLFGDDLNEFLHTRVRVIFFDRKDDTQTASYISLFICVIRGFCEYIIGLFYYYWLFPKVWQSDFKAWQVGKDI